MFLLWQENEKTVSQRSALGGKETGQDKETERKSDRDYGESMYGQIIYCPLTLF